MFGDTDFVVEIGLSIEAADLGSAAAAVERLADGSGAAAVEFRAADPHGGRSGFLVTLIVVRPGPEPAPPGRTTPGRTTSDHTGHDPTDPAQVAGRIRAVAAPVLAAWGLPERHLFLYDSPNGPAGSYEGPERAAAGHTVLWLTVHTGRAASADRPDGLAGTGCPPSGWRRRRVLPLPADDDDIVARVHAMLPARTPGDAARACLPLAEALRAGAIEVLPATVLDAGATGYAVALLTTLHPDRAERPGGKTPGDGGAGTGAVAREREALLRAVLSITGRLGIGGGSPTVLARDKWLVGVLEYPPSRPVASPSGIGVQAVYARRAADPFGAVDAFAVPETRELVTDDVWLSDQEIADIAELVRLLDPGTERPGGAAS